MMVSGFFLREHFELSCSAFDKYNVYLYGKNKLKGMYNFWSSLFMWQELNCCEIPICAESNCSKISSTCS